VIERVGVVVPAHNEQDLLPLCLDSLEVAISKVPDVEVRMVVVLDSCTDRTRAVLMTRPWIARVEIDARSVGTARAAGARRVIAGTNSLDPSALWLATTDADSMVPTGWLRNQVDLANSGWEVIVGTVTVPDWSEHPDAVKRLWAESYQAIDDHPHVHGANFGCRADAYLESGGWSPLALSEDVALLAAMSHRRVLRTPLIPVATSARTSPRAPGGFGDTLRSMAG
jgi:glycosyltransferase involved in cell wall biosynthesis